MPTRKSARKPNKRVMDGDSNPNSECQSDHSDLSNNREASWPSEYTMRSEVNEDTSQLVNDTDNQYFMRRQSNQDHDNANYVMPNSNTSSPSRPFHRIPKTPKTFPRTKIDSKTSIAQRVALQSLRQHMTFSNGDEVCANNQSPESDGENNLSQPRGATGGMPESNQVLVKLVQMHDDINQVSSMIETLENLRPCPKVQEQLNKLMKIRDQLMSSESQLKTVYHKLTLALREEAVGAVDGREKYDPPIPFNDCSEPDNDIHPSQDTDDQNNDVSSVKNFQVDLNNREALHQKLLSYQDKLRSIRMKQAASDETISLQVKAMQKQHDRFSTLQPSKTKSIEIDTVSSSSLPSYLLRATPQEHINFERSECLDEKPAHPPRLAMNAVPSDSFEVSRTSPVGLQHSMIRSSKEIHEQKQNLENKMHDLKQKKHQIDQFLKEISKLKEMETDCSTVLNESSADRQLEPKSINVPSYMPPQMEELSSIACIESLSDAQNFFNNATSDEKQKELLGMKDKLRQINKMISTVDWPCNNSDISESFEKAACLESFRNASDANVNKKSLKIKKEDFTQARRRDWSPEGHCSADEEPQNNETAVSNDNFDNLANHLEIQQKMRKLQEAKDKLSRLQELMNAVQEAKEGGFPALARCKQLLNVIGEINDDEGSNSRNSRCNSEIQQHESSVVEPTQASGIDKEKLVKEYSLEIGKLNDQLDQIVEEKKKLLEVQEQLSLQMQTPLNNESKAPHKASNTLQPVKMESFSNIRLHPSFHSNSELRDSCPSDQLNFGTKTKAPMSHSQSNSMMTLRDELTRQKHALKELIKEEQEKQETFLQNEDNQSEQNMKFLEQYNKVYRTGENASESVNHSATTWSGSNTHDNLDEGDQNFDESQEETDIYSEEDQHIPPINTSAKRLSRSRIPNDISLQGQNNTSRDRTSNNNIWNRHNPLLYNEPRIESSNVEMNRSSSYHQDHIERTRIDSATCSNGSRNNHEGNFIPSVNPSQLLQKMDENILLCQTILRDQQALNAFFQSSFNASSHNIPNPAVNTEQQMRFNLFICYNMMCQQQIDIHQMQQQLNQLLRSRSNEDYSNNLGSNSNAHTTFDDNQMSSAQGNLNNSSLLGPQTIPSVLNTFSMQFQPNQNAMLGSLVNSNQIVNPVSLGEQSSTETPKTLNNQVAPGMRANNYWDNFRSCSRQNLLSIPKTNHQTTYQTVPSCLIPSQFVSSHVPMASLGPNLIDSSNIVRNESQQEMPSASARMPNSDETINGENLIRKALKKTQVNKEQIPDLKNMCIGSQSLPNVRESFEQNFGNISSQSAAPTQAKPAEMPATHSVSSSQYASVKSKPETEREHHQNENFLEEIYSEAASLISKNESRPMYLMELFRELKLIDNDDFRLNALYSLHNLSSKSAQGSQDNLTRKSEQQNLMTEVDSNKVAFNFSKLSNKGSSHQLQSFVNNSRLPADSRSEVSRKKQNSSSLPSSLPIKMASIPSKPSSQSAGTTQKIPQHISSSPIAGNAVHEITHKSTGAIKKRRMCHPSQSPEEQPVTEMSPIKIDEKVQNVITKILPFIRVNVDEPCQPKILNNICKLAVTLTREACIECNASDPPEVMQHRLKQILQDVTMKFSGRRLKECVEELLGELSEVIFNDLAYNLLIRNMRQPTQAAISSNIRSMIQTLNCESSSLEACSNPAASGGEFLATSEPINIELVAGGESKPPALSPNFMGQISELENSLFPKSESGIQSAEVVEFHHGIALDEPGTEPEADISNKDLAEADQSPQPSSHCHAVGGQAASMIAGEGENYRAIEDSILEVAEDDIVTASGGLAENIESYAAENSEETTPKNSDENCTEEDGDLVSDLDGKNPKQTGTPAE